MNDEHYMKLAIGEAAKSKGPKRFGAVLVAEGKVLARARNTTYESNDPITCAEVNAISKAARKLGNRKLVPSTLYVTGESCLMCIGAILRTNINRIVYGFNHDDFTKLDGRTSINPWSRRVLELTPPTVEVKFGVLKKECEQVLFNPSSLYVSSQEEL